MHQPLHYMTATNFVIFTSSHSLATNCYQFTDPIVRDGRLGQPAAPGFKPGPSESCGTRGACLNYSVTLTFTLHYLFCRMSFGSDLQGWQSHEALLSCQDYEIHLLESMRKCIAQRAKCDREYATSLLGIVRNVTQKLDNTVVIDTPVGQVCFAFDLACYTVFPPINGQD